GIDAVLPRLAHHVARDDDLLDLAGALVETEQPDIAIEALDAVVGDIAGAAVDLHRPVGDTAGHLAGEQFTARRFGGDVLTGVAAGGSVEYHTARGVGLGAAVGEHRLDELELDDWLAELVALHRVTQA